MVAPLYIAAVFLQFTWGVICEFESSTENELSTHSPGLKALLKTDNCTTPDGDSGTCKNIYMCKSMIDFLEQTDKDDAYIERLKTFECGTDMGTMKVCCPNHAVPKTFGNEINLYPPDVNFHRNIELLPVFTCGVSGAADCAKTENVSALLEFPWMALLSYKTPTCNQSLKCGGTIINERYILTAAHCITNLKAKTLIGVRLGEHDLSTDKDCETSPCEKTICADPVQDLEIEEAIPHPKFNPKKYAHDIGLLRLKTKINFDSANVKPICLPIFKSLRSMDQGSVVTGWGRLKNKKKSNVLLKTKMSVIDSALCKIIYEKYNVPITYLQLCAGDDASDSCRSGSGGPLQSTSDFWGATRYVQHAIVSFGPTDCEKKGQAGVFTKIVYYMDWILNNLRP